MPQSPRRTGYSPDSAMLIWQSRTDLAKQEVAATNAATDAKTARLRALRLAKEAQDAEAARAVETAAPVPKNRGKPGS